MVLIPHQDTKMKHNLKDLLSSQIELDFHFIGMACVHLQLQISSDHVQVFVSSASLA